MKRVFYITIISLAMLLFVAGAQLGYAADVSADFQNPDRDQPLEVTAEHVLEWHRNSQQYIARGDAKIKQGQLTISADVITADYRDNPDEGMEIYRLTASGDVEINSQGNTGHGERLVYDVDRGVAVLTGDDLRLVSPDQVVKANESFEYWVAAGRLKAVGQALVIRATDTIAADTMAAIFKQNTKTGKRELDSMEAKGNVRIKTDTEVLTGERAEYKAQTNLAKVIGDVEISRGKSVLRGERAEVNLATNISKLFGEVQPASAAGAAATGGGAAGAGESTGRVRGVFYPGEKPQVSISGDDNSAQ